MRATAIYIANQSLTILQSFSESSILSVTDSYNYKPPEFPRQSEHWPGKRCRSQQGLEDYQYRIPDCAGRLLRRLCRDWWVLLPFHIQYIEPPELPFNIILKRWKPPIVIGVSMVAWGIVMTLMCLVRNAAGLQAARFFLGFTEGGYVKGHIVRG